MRKWIVRLLSVLVIAAVLAGLLLAGGSAQIRIFPELSDAELSEWPTAETALEQTPELLGLSQMKQVGKSGDITLYYHETTGELAVQTVYGQVWYSNPQNRMDFDILTRGHYSSLFYVNVITANESEKTLYSYDDCVQYGQTKTSEIDGGVRIEYLFGRAAKQQLYPMALTEERYKEIADQLSEAELLYFSRYYSPADVSLVKDPQILETLKQTYTQLETLKKIYILKNNPSVLEINRLLGFLEKVGYTVEDRERDHRLTGYRAAASENDHFILPVEYAVKNGSLHVRIRTDELRTLGLLKVESLVLLPFWNTQGATSTEIVVPDGSGAVIDLGKTVSSATPDYEEPFYGADYSLSAESRTSVKETLSLPIYGLINNENGFYAEVLPSDAASAGLLVTPKTADKPLGTAGFTFRILHYATTKLLADDDETVRSYPDWTDCSPLEAVYTFPQSCQSFMDIATEYRTLLEQRGLLPEASGRQKVPAVIRLLGAIDDIEPFLGVPKEKIRALTTFKQSETLLDTLQTSMPDAQLAVQLTGWQKGGVKSGIASDFRAEKALGGRKGFEALLRSADAKEILLYPDADLCYAYRDSVFDGFVSSRDAARTILSEKAYKPTYSPANFNADSKRLLGYLLKPSVMEKSAKTIAEKAASYGLERLSLPNLGKELSGDFSEDAPVSRKKAASAVSGALESLSKSALSLMTEGVNAYVLPYADFAYGVSMQSNPHPLITDSVPLVQAVLSGRVRYAASSFNRASDPELYALKCVETGSALYATMMAADNTMLKDTAYDTFGSVSVQNQAERIARAVGTVTEALKDVYGACMTGYQKTDGVVRITYENNVTVVVNYNDFDVSLPEGNSVSARSCAVLKGEASQ